jgi:hypothetical protein
MATSNLSLHEQNVANIIEKAKESLGPNHDQPSILDEHGIILYSSCETLKKGKYYFLGLNPGGKDEDVPPILTSLDDLRSYKGNAYFAEDDRADWSSPKRHYAKGQHPYQIAFRTLFEGFGENPRDVCASNLIFKRSVGAHDSGYPKLAKKCWPVHEAILKIVQPEAIIAFGKDAFDFVRRKCSVGHDQVIEVPQGFWLWKHSMLDNNIPLICVRHPSRYSLKKSVASEIKEFLGPIILHHA